MFKKLLFLEELLPVGAMILMCFVCILQVFFRYVMQNSLDWPEELARMMFIVSTFLAAGITAKQGSHLEIDMAKHLFGPIVRKIAYVVSTVSTLIFCVFMLFWGIPMIQFVIDSGQDSAALPFPMWIFWVAIPVGMSWMGVRSVTHCINSLKKNQKESNI